MYFVNFDVLDPYKVLYVFGKSKDQFISVNSVYWIPSKR